MSIHANPPRIEATRAPGRDGTTREEFDLFELVSASGATIPQETAE